MTQKYYTKRLLLVYITTIQKARVLSHPSLEENNTGNLIEQSLQEDNGGSHSHRRPSQNTKKSQLRSLAIVLKEDNQISTLNHPSQSPDLNPIEGIQCILKQRARRHIQRSLEELKRILQDEWDKITIEEIREHITEMLERCFRLVKSGGALIKGAKQ